ncbi:MAG: hypothetical protein DRH37_00270 [Deltaproteobacteria bacterium]|nr:MAG: hypothetical protein DRH37_00270 [Deltaproteobacteria bacterium]
MMRFFRKLFVLSLILLTATVVNARTPDSSSAIHLHIRTFTLKNGMLFLVVNRPALPQVACRIAIRAGSALEESGRTGLAHMLEHMMFKGTKNFGTLNVKLDQELQKRIENAYQTVLAQEERRHPDDQRIQAKIKEMNALRIQVQKIYVPHAFSSQLESNGATGVNAFTTKDQTQFTASVPSDMLELWFSMISEQLFEPSWREFYVEKEVVQREWAYRYVNNPAGAAWLDLFSTAYTAHPYRNPTIGWKSDMEKFSATAAAEFHRKYYNPRNAVCVLVGDVTVRQAKALAGIYFERYPAGKRAPEQVTREPVQQGPRRSIHYLKGAKTPLIRIGFHGARMGTKDFYALDVLSGILSAGRSARMTRNIVEKGLAVEAWAANPDNRYGGMFILGGSPNDPEELGKPNLNETEKRGAYLRACEDLEKRLLAEAERFRTVRVSERELDRIKKLNQREFLDRLRNNEQLAGSLATLEVQIGWSYMTDYLEKIAEITPEDIRKVARKYLMADNRTTAFVIPGGVPEHPPEPYEEIRSVSRSSVEGAAVPRNLKNNSIYPTPKGWKHPLSFRRKPKKIEYPKAQTADINGTTLFYLPDRELPLIDLTLLVRAGSVDLDDAKTGLTMLLNGCLIRGGTEKHAPSELALALDENAIRLSVSAREEETVVRLSVMKDDWEKGISLLKEVLTQPAFDPDVLRVTKQMAVTALKRQAGSAAAVCRREAKIWRFRGHPYGRDPLLGLKTIPSLSREDLKAFMKTYFVPSNMVAAVAGDIDRQNVIKALSSLFQALPQKPAPARKLGVPPATPPVLALIHKPGQVQSQVGLSLSSVRRTNPNYWKLNLLMDVFGGSDSLMYTRLRDDLGLIYAGGFFETYKWKAGILVGYIGCRGDKTAQAIRETVKIMNVLRKDVPSTALEQKRLDVLNSFVFNVDTPAALVDTYATYRLRGEPLDTLERIQDAFMRATKTELEALARRFLVPKKLQIFVVGDKNTRVTGGNGEKITLEQSLKSLAKHLGLPFREIPLR